jgi:hypothetical protein
MGTGDRLIFFLHLSITLLFIIGMAEKNPLDDYPESDGETDGKSPQEKLDDLLKEYEEEAMETDPGRKLQKAVAPAANPLPHTPATPTVIGNDSNGGGEGSSGSSGGGGDGGTGPLSDRIRNHSTTTTTGSSSSALPKAYYNIKAARKS